jgi:hypothetical protein
MLAGRRQDTRATAKITRVKLRTASAMREILMGKEQPGNRTSRRELCRERQQPSSTEGKTHEAQIQRERKVDVIKPDAKSSLFIEIDIRFL